MSASPSTPPSTSPVRRADVDVWLVGLSVDAETLAGFNATLSSDERARAMSFYRAEDARRFVAARGALRRILGERLGLEPAGLSFAKGPHGKPELADPRGGVQFNLSHSGDHALIALSQDRAVGVDIELKRESVDIDGIVGSTFSPDERRQWTEISLGRRREAFFHGWVCKEAYAKALGKGFSHPSTAYSVRMDPDAEPGLLADEVPGAAAGNWCLKRVAAPEGYAAAVALPGYEAAVSLARFGL